MRHFNADCYTFCCILKTESEHFINYIMLENDYVKIFSGTFIIVQLVVDRLESVGINGIVKDEAESARMAGFGSSFQGYQELYVAKEELDHAIQIVAAVKGELEI